MAKVSVIGAGSWGTALAVLLRKNGHEVTLWSIMEDEIRMISEKHEQADKLPGVRVDESIRLTTDLREAAQNRDVIIMAVPSIHIRSTSKSMAPHIRYGQLIINVAKGIEDGTLMTLPDIIAQEIPQAEVALLSGPSHAEEVGIGLPTTVVAGAKRRRTAEYVQSIFMSDTFRVYTSPDMIGMELGAALKNVIALAAGMADGLGYGDNTKAALITRGMAEISRLAIAMGAKPETLSGLSGMGDLIVTCASRHSRNRKAGMLMGQGYTMQEAMDEVHMVVEGVYSAKAALALAKKYEISMPIIEQVNAVLFDGYPVKEAVSNLMMRDRKSEYQELDWEES